MSNEKKKASNFIQHFLLDPIKTPTEATARIKEIIPYLAVSFGAVVLLLVLGNLIKAIAIVFNILSFICMAFVFLFGWCLFRAVQMKMKLANLECSNCKNIIKYDDNVTYKINSQELKISEHKNQNSKAGVDIYLTGTEYVGLTITCKCQKCGTEKKFNHVFTPIKLETKKQVGVSALNADILLREMKDLMQKDYQARFANASADYKIKSNMTIDKAVKDYFCDDGTAGKTPYGTVTKNKK